jgi:two-component system sensor histidine kinase CpxA
MRFPLYSKVLVWLGLNILIGLAVAYALTARDEAGLNALLTRSVRERTDILARSVAAQTAALDEPGRSTLLQRLSAQDGVSWTVSGDLGAGLDDGPPRSNQGPPFGDHSSGGPFFGNRDSNSHDRGPPPEDFGPGGPGPGGQSSDHVDPVNIVSTVGPPGYDVVVDTYVHLFSGPPRRVQVVAHLASLPALLGFLGLGPVIATIAVVLLMTCLWWWPFVWNVSHALRDLRGAAQQMSRGHLQTRVQVNRRDELGELGAAVNTMAERLDSYVQGQRQFIADIAHEVTAPLARMQMGIGMLEDRLGNAQSELLADVREDIDQMAEMLNELLLFSRSGLEAARTAPKAVSVIETVSGVVRADCQDAPVHIDVPQGLKVLVPAPLFQRALSNLLRNAHRYGADGSIEVNARTDQGRAYIAVQDRGPGVPEAALVHLGEPFFRPEVARSRITGGFGLGLAIVRRCVEACGGAVAFRNRSGGGFEAELNLPLAEGRLT